MLQTEGDANDCEAEYSSKDQVSYSQLPAQEQDPEDIADNASHSKPAYFYIPAKRPENKPREFKALQTERDADNGQADQDSGNSPQKSADNAAQDKP